MKDDVVILTFQSTPKLRDELDLLAKQLDRSRSWCLKKAAENFLASDPRSWI